VDFDPSIISYEELLTLFWQFHRPINPPWSRQYMSAIYCADEQQLAIAERLKVDQTRVFGAPVTTEIQSNDHFYMAEDYHQKYRLQRQADLMDELKQFYPRFRDLIDAPTTARLNAYLGGHLNKDRLNDELASFGLSEKGDRILTKLVR